MKDQRLFAKFALDFADSRKVLPLSDGAFRCLVEAIIWSRKEMSDGWLARRLALAKWSPADLHELSTNDPENPSLIESEDGWQIHDFAAMQDTKAEIDARRERNRINGQKGGIAKGKRAGKRVAKPTASDSGSENVAETETDSLSPYGDKEVPRKRVTPRKRIAEDYMPERRNVDKLRSEFPGTTDTQFRTIHEDFCLYWQGQGRPMADWDATWLRWMRKELAKPQTRNGNPIATSDARFAQAQALKLVVPDDRLEIER